MTPITLQDGKIVLRDGKVGTEQACCCGCPQGCECLSALVCARGASGLTDEDGNFLTQEDYQELADEWLAYTLAWMEANNILSAIEDAGYEAVVISNQGADSTPFGWTANVNISYRCCGEIDTEAEPIVIYDDDTAAEPWDEPAVPSGIGGGDICPGSFGGGGYFELPPCNPLP